MFDLLNKLLGSQDRIFVNVPGAFILVLPSWLWALAQLYLVLMVHSWHDYVMIMTHDALGGCKRLDWGLSKLWQLLGTEDMSIVAR